MFQRSVITKGCTCQHSPGLILDINQIFLSMGFFLQLGTPLISVLHELVIRY